MATINKGGFYLIILILGGYYGVLPLIGVNVWVRNDGWVQIDIGQSVFNIIVSLVIIIYIKVKSKENKNKK